MICVHRNINAVAFLRLAYLALEFTLNWILKLKWEKSSMFLWDCLLRIAGENEVQCVGAPGIPRHLQQQKGSSYLSACHFFPAIMHDIKSFSQHLIAFTSSSGCGTARLPFRKAQETGLSRTRLPILRRRYKFTSVFSWLLLHNHHEVWFNLMMWVRMYKVDRCWLARSPLLTSWLCLIQDIML